MTAGGVCWDASDTGVGSAAMTPSATAGRVVAMAAPAAIRAAREPVRAASLRALGSRLWRWVATALIPLLLLSGVRPEMTPRPRWVTIRTRRPSQAHHRRGVSIRGLPRRVSAAGGLVRVLGQPQAGAVGV